MRMATSGTDRRASGRESGFTLLELLAVMALIALAAVMVTVSGSRSLETARLRAFLIKTQTALIETRTAAIRSAEEKVLTVDTASRNVGGTIAIPRGVDLTAEVAQAEQHGGLVGIRFYPAGTSSGGRLTIRAEGTAYEIRVNWLTGHATLRKL